MLAIAVYFWQYIVGKKHYKAKFCYLQYETTVTTAETSSRGQHRLICDMVLFTSSAGCPHCTLAHSTPWEGSGNRFTARIFHPAPSEKALKYRKCFWPSGSVPLDGEAASQQESRCSSATRRKGTITLVSFTKKNCHVESEIMVGQLTWCWLICSISLLHSKLVLPPSLFTLMSKAAGRASRILTKD